SARSPRPASAAPRARLPPTPAARSARRSPCRWPQEESIPVFHGRIPRVSAPALRPLGIGEILDVGIKIYWRHALTLFRIVLFVVLPAQILVNVVQVSALPAGVTGTFSTNPFGPNFQSSDTAGLSGGDTA